MKRDEHVMKRKQVAAVMYLPLSPETTYIHLSWVQNNVNCCVKHHFTAMRMIAAMPASLVEAKS